MATCCQVPAGAIVGKETKGTAVSRSVIISGQIIATSHDLTPNGGLVREIPLFQGNLGW